MADTIHVCLAAKWLIHTELLVKRFERLFGSTVLRNLVKPVLRYTCLRTALERFQRMHVYAICPKSQFGSNRRKDDQGYNSYHPWREYTGDSPGKGYS